MVNLDIEKFIKIKCIEENIKINQLASKLNMSRQLMWHHIKKKNKEVLSGRTSTNKIVLFKGDMALKGQFVDVKINECKTWTLYGDIV